MRLVPTGDLGAGRVTPSLQPLAHVSFPASHPRDQREEELGEYYMKKYAKSSVGET